MPSSCKTVTFFDLPLNIRNRIYRLVLVKCGRHIRLRRVPSLLQVNQQIRKEAFPIRYGENKFYIMPDVNFSRACPMIRTLAESGCFSHISSITMRCMSHCSRTPHLDLIVLDKPCPLQKKRYRDLWIGSDDTDWSDLDLTKRALHHRFWDILYWGKAPWKRTLNPFQRGAVELFSIIADGYLNMSDKWLVMELRHPEKRNYIVPTEDWIKMTWWDEVMASSTGVTYERCSFVGMETLDGSMAMWLPE